MEWKPTNSFLVPCLFCYLNSTIYNQYFGLSITLVMCPILTQLDLTSLPVINILQGLGLSDQFPIDFLCSGMEEGVTVWV